MMKSFIPKLFSIDWTGMSFLGVRTEFCLFQVQNNNDTITFQADEDASENYIDAWRPGTPAVADDPNTPADETKEAEPGGHLYEAYQTYLQSIEEQNRFSWVNHLLVPGLQAAANIAILQFQKSQYDDIEQRRIGYLDAAVEQWCNCVQEVLDKIEEATDDVPEPAMYQPVSPSGEQYETISDNLEIAKNVGQPYICYLNETHREQDFIRQVALNPKHYEVNEITWCSISDLIKGELPESLVVETLTRSKEKALVNGRFGRSCRQSARDLGLTSYRVQKAAREEARLERASQNRDVNPITRHADLREMMVTPQQRIGYAIQQGQLIQNSLQNAYNACARKAPFLQAQVQVMLQKCQQELTLLAGKAGLVNANVPDFASVLNSQIRDVIGGIGNGVNNGFGVTQPSTVTAPPAPAPQGNTGNFGGSVITPSK